MSNYPTKIGKNSPIKYTNECQTPDYCELFKDAFFLVQKAHTHPIGVLQIDDNNASFTFEGLTETLTSIFYVMGALAERRNNFNTFEFSVSKGGEE